MLSAPLFIIYFIIMIKKRPVDGYRHNKGVTIATNAFSDIENKLLINALNKKFALNSRLIRDHNYPSIHIPYSSMS